MNITKCKAIVGISAISAICGSLVTGKVIKLLNTRLNNNRVGVMTQKENGRKYYAQVIRQLRWRLDDAYQQMQQGQLRYALYDAYVVFEGTMKILIQSVYGTEDIGDDALQNMKICEQEHLLGNDKEFIGRLREVIHICRISLHDIAVQNSLNHGKVHFAIMQVKELLNLAEEILVKA
ncbi:MAG: hypothetical protein Q4C91_07240 [Eubacteriales bacterium]|nr:hypothetical protein [Eubacteriales bacterium]